MALRKTQNQYYGSESDLPDTLPEGSTFIALDTGSSWIYGEDDLPFNTNVGDSTNYNTEVFNEIVERISRGDPYVLNGQLSQVVEHNLDTYVNYALYDASGNSFQTEVIRINNNSLQLISNLPLNGVIIIT